MATSSPASSSRPQITSSRCMTEHITATLNFEMTNYLQLKGLGAGQFVRSPVFRVGGYDWEMRFYPDGLNHDECEGSASCFLYCHKHDKDVSATFTLSLLETTTKQGQQKQAAVACFGMTDRVFSSGNDDWGYKRFVDRSKLKSLARQGDGCFTIRCVLTVRNDDDEAARPLELALAGDLERMLKDGRGADVTFSVRGQEVRARRSILAARSPIFKAQLFGRQMEEEKDMLLRRVEVIDMEPTIFEMMLHYIYTDSLPPPCSDDGGGGGGYKPAVMQHLLVAAHNYGLGRLKQMCEVELCKRLDAQTVTATLALADQHQCERLKKTCVGFMSSPGVMAAVVETHGFKDHLKTCSQQPLLTLEVLPAGRETTTTTISGGDEIIIHDGEDLKDTASSSKSQGCASLGRVYPDA